MQASELLIQSMKHFRVEPPGESFQVTQERAFINHGMKLMNRHTMGGRKVFDRRFKAFFGVKPMAVVIVWRLLKKKKWFETKMSTEPNKEHLLWAMRFMKSYSTEEIHAAEVQKNEKTWRKWTWLYLEGIASVTDEVVSLNFYLVI